MLDFLIVVSMILATWMVGVGAIITIFALGWSLIKGK
jgi:hypothetical protein